VESEKRKHHSNTHSEGVYAESADDIDALVEDLDAPAAAAAAAQPAAVSAAVTTPIESPTTVVNCSCSL
jgi:hypothetical protein